MPQLTFQFQQDGKPTDGPTIETLIHCMAQCNLKYDDIQKNHPDDGGDEESATENMTVTIDFSTQEEANKAMEDLNGKEVMGSQLIMKPTNNHQHMNGDSSEEKKGRRSHGHSRGYREYNNTHYSQRGGRYNGGRRYNSRQNRMNPNPYTQSYQQQQQQPAEMEQYPCRLLIPNEMVKVILGKGGATITSIQNKTNTKIDIHREKGGGRGRQPEDVLTSIKGEPAAFSDAIRELLLVINAEYENNESGEELPPLQLKLLAHDLLCGRIIGKGGNNLRAVRQESGVTKLIISNSIYDEGGQFGPHGMMASLGERVVTIEGTVDAICAAEEIVSQRLRDYMEKDLKNSNNSNQNMSNGGNQQQQANGGGYDYSHMPNNAYPNMHMMYQQRSPYQQTPMGGYGGYYPYSYANNYPGLLGQGYPPFSGMMASPPQVIYGEEEVCSISIPTKEVGAIIGRNGVYINRMKQYSFAQVRVVKGEEGGESRVEIKGTPDAQWRASLCVFGKIKETMKVPYSDAKLKTEYMVPGSCVGRIIGKKGQVVQDIQDKAQTDIEVPKDKQGGDDVPVYITGNFNGTQIALNRIRDIVQRAHSRVTNAEEQNE